LSKDPVLPTPRTLEAVPWAGPPRPARHTCAAPVP
jgi:hypothetical protein